jgi:murein DD-endopeptidase MepM/ murein hydrolase activator NlpD
MSGRGSRVAVVIGWLAAAMAVGSLAVATPEPIEVPAGWPLAADRGRLSSSFGGRRGKPHQGLDLSASAGTPVWATAGGVVAFAGWSGDFGQLVVIDHGGGWQTRYAHLRCLEVGEGDTVERGAQVGEVGRSGNATGYHLHYELRYEGQPVDPRLTLKR